MSLGILLLYYGFSIYYRLPLHTDFLSFSLATFLFIFSVCCIGILASILLPTQLKATEVLMVVATPSFILSGFTWPLSQMPLWVQYLADVILSTHYLKIYQTLFVEQGNFSNIRISLWFLFLIGILYFALATLFLNFKIRKIEKIRNIDANQSI